MMMMNGTMSQSVAFRFPETSIVTGYPTTLEITLNNVVLGEGYSVRNIAIDEYVSLPEESNWGNPLFSHGAMDYLCVDSTTKQVVGELRLRSSGYRFTLHQTLQTARSRKWTETSAATVQPKLTVNCPVVVKSLPEDGKVELDLEYYIVSGSDDSPSQAGADLSKATVTFPTKFERPSVAIKSASLVSPKSMKGTGKLDMSFTTNYVGQYNLTISNGFNITARSLNKFEHSPFFCTSGSNKEAARIVIRPVQLDDQSFISQVYLVVDKVLTSDISCSFNVNFVRNFVNSEKALIRLAIGDVAVTHSVDYTPVPAVAFAAFGVGHGDWFLQFSTLSLDNTSTPLNTNGTVTFKFGTQIDTSLLKLSASEQHYRGFSCEDAINQNNVYFTVFVSKNEITLKDASTSVAKLQCSFEFDTAAAFNHKDDNKMSSVVVSIDGKPLEALHATGNKIPLYRWTEAGEFFLLNTQFTTSLDTGVYSVTQEFDIKDSYKTFFTTPNDVVAVLSFVEAPWKNEEVAAQLKCQYTTPSSSVFVPLTLIFDSRFNTFTAQLKELKGVESYAIKISCSYKIPQVFGYGIDITPNRGLELNVLNLVDGHREIAKSSSRGAFALTQASATKPDGVTLPRHAQTCVLSGYVTFPATKAAVEAQAEIQTALDAAQAAAFKNTKFTDGSGEVDYSTAFSITSTGLKMGGNDDYEYVNASVQQSTYKYFFETKKNFFTGSWDDMFVLDWNFITPYQTSVNALLSPQGFSTSISSLALFRSEFTLTRNAGATAQITASDFQNTFRSSMSNSLYDLFADKVMGTDTFIPLNTYLYVDCNSHSVQTGCGYATPLMTSDDFPSMGEEMTWGSYTFDSIPHCHAGQTCATNADCSTGLVCKAAVCAQADTSVIPPYVDFTMVATTSLQKELYSSVSVLSYGAAIVGVVLAVMF